MKPFIILPFGMTADVAARIIQCWEHNDSDTEENQDNFIEEFLSQDEKNAELLSKLKVLETPGAIASWRRGFHDAVARSRMLAYLDHYSRVVNTVPDSYTKGTQPLGWEPMTYIEGWKAATDVGSWREEAGSDDGSSLSHYRVITADGGNGCVYLREMTFDRRKEEWFSWEKVGEYIKGMAPNAIDSVIIDKLRGRTVGDDIIEIPYPSARKPDEQEVWSIQ